MKKSIFTAGLLLLCTSLSAQIRNYVGIVREQYFQSHIDFMEKYRDNLKDSGLKTYSEYIDGYLKGGFGSGFIYVDSDGTNYIITNRHVVSQAEKASIEFEDSETGEVTKYENLTVLITDDDIDIAILKFEDGKNPFKKGLTISNKKINDGDDVLSAGFPGLGGDPVWQLGKGSISNAHARIKDLLDPSISTVIQHSAQVHGGNSGGPLLITSSTGTAGYEVIGINTWKAAGRDSTNFSIPAKLALDLIEKSKKSIDEEAAKAERLAKLKEILTDSESDYTDIVKFISYEYATSAGPAFFKEITGRGSANVRSRVVNEFSYSPAEGLRYATAYKFYEKYSKDNATDENLSSIVWVKEHGIFRASLTLTKDEEKSVEKAKKSNQSGGIPAVGFDGIEHEVMMAINIGGNFALKTDNTSKDFNFLADLDIFPFYKLWGIGIMYENRSLAGTRYNLFGGQFIVALPVNMSLFTIKPYVDAGFCSGMGKSEFTSLGTSMPKIVIGGFAEAGAEIVFDLGLSSFRPGINVSYKLSAYDIDNDIDVTFHDLSIKLVLGFSFD